ncbi:hypothetical protein V6N13_008041 [Hibiscus sabdariffa]
MTMVCSNSSIQSRLTEWGLGEIKVQRLGGKSFLLTIIDDELFLMLEDLGWSYLKEIFTNVELWSEKVSSKISEIVEVEVGNLSFLVRVEEKGLLDQPTKLPVGVSNLKKASEKIYQVEDSTSSTSLDSSLKSSSGKGVNENGLKIPQPSGVNDEFNGCLNEEEKALIELERKKKIRAFRKNKLNKKALEVYELSERLLSDSDLSIRWDILTKKARKTLKLGKKIGLWIDGNEEEVVKELASLELANIKHLGLLLIWDRSKTNVDLEVQIRNFILVRGRWVNEGALLIGLPYGKVWFGAVRSEDWSRFVH